MPQILAPLLGGGALHCTAVRLALIIMAAAGLASILLVIGAPPGLTMNPSAKA